MNRLTGIRQHIFKKSITIFNYMLQFYNKFSSHITMDKHAISSTKNMKFFMSVDFVWNFLRIHLNYNLTFMRCIEIKTVIDKQQMYIPLIITDGTVIWLVKKTKFVRYLLKIWSKLDSSILRKGKSCSWWQISNLSSAFNLQTSLPTMVFFSRSVFTCNR